MFKKILVPIDFSETARAALQYALEASKHWKSREIHVIHVFTPEVPGDSLVIPSVESFLQAKEEALKDFVNGVEKPKGVRVSSELLIGFPADIITEQSPDYELIVMGTTGASGWINRVFGSVSIAVAQRAKCPVLLIPNDSVYQELRHMVFACDIHAIDSDVVDYLKNINSEIKTTLHFVHVRSEETPDAFEDAKEQLLADLFKTGEPPFGFEINEVDEKGQSIAEAIRDYADSHKADAIALVTYHRGIWEQLFHKSQTKQIAQHTRLPLLVFHAGD